MKQNLITEQQVFEKLKKFIAETLRVDENIVKHETSLVKELDAESLDFLDINYQLEQAFGIKMARHFVLEHAEEMFGEGSVIDENGKLTERAVELLRIRFGKDTPDLVAGMDVDQVPPLITVQSIVRAVMDLLDTLPEKCPRCGNTAWKSEDGTHILCNSCGEDAPFTNGDDLTKEWLRRVQEEKKIFPVGQNDHATS